MHRDQGQVPATADFPAACNLFWMLDDFTPERGSTCVVPGSHRWHPDHLVNPPSRDLQVQIEAPAGTVFAWDGRLWHGTGSNLSGHPRRHIANFFCLPWMRQQENWGVTCLQEVLDEASPKLRARLGLRTYGTLGMMSGTHTNISATLGNYDVQIPEYVIGEGGELHAIKRVSKS
ncbi:MAG: phytanoyl-CoA dioxygenase family protein [Pseudomonadota bacterium]